MSQVDLATSVGYALKRAAVALRTAMEAELRECRLTVSQYSCLELLFQRAGLTNAELARGVFLTRQASHQLLAGLIEDGLIQIKDPGRFQKVVLTDLGAERLADASHRVAEVEQRMLTELTGSQQTQLLSSLTACVDALQGFERRSS